MAIVTVTETYSFADALAVAAAIMGTPPDRLDTLASRLKQWQKLGYPRGSRTGRGIKADYTIGMIWEVAVMAELANLGLTPKVAGEILGASGSMPRRGAQAVRQLRGSRSTILIDMDRLSALVHSQLGEPSWALA
jgi:hypothetical protein